MVGGNVVTIHLNDPRVFVEHVDRDPDQRSVFEIESAQRICRSAAQRFALPLFWGIGAKIDKEKIAAAGWRNELRRLAIDEPKGRPLHFMTRNEL